MQGILSDSVARHKLLKGTRLHNHMLVRVDGTLKHPALSININDQTNRLEWSCLRGICIKQGLVQGNEPEARSAQVVNV